MATELAPWSAARVGASPRQVIARFTGRKAARSGILWGYIFGLTIASSALGYVSAYKTPLSRERFAAIFGSNAGLDAITGPANRLQTVAGYTAWKSLAFLSVLGAVWGLLLATRLLRGEEEAGRWELMLAGKTTRRRALAQVLVGLGVGLLALFVVTALIAVIVGHSSKVDIGVGAMLFFTLAIVSSVVVFVATGALTSQLAATRRQAAGYAGAALGVAFAFRMVADSGTGLNWLRWVTPLGWVEELQPLTSPRPLALLPIAALTAVLLIAALHLAGKRDLGASVLSDRSSAEAHTALLFGPGGLSARLMRPTVLAWAGAIAAIGLLLGFVAKQAGSAFTSTPSLERIFAKFGAHGSGAQAYLGIVSLMVAALVGFIAIGQVTMARAEEAEGHLEHFLVRPVARLRWLGDRLLIAVVVLVASGLLAGFSTWVGAASQHSDIGLARLLGAGLNLVPPALCLLGLGVLGIGLWPRATVGLAYGFFAWSLLVEIVGSAVNANRFLLDTSLFHQITAAPAVAPNLVSDGLLVALGAAAAAVGAIAFRRRDLSGA